jgi:hypothetical protein
MNRHTIELLSDLRHPDANLVEAAFPTFFNATLLDAILASEPLARAENAGGEEKVETSQWPAFSKGEAIDDHLPVGTSVPHRGRPFKNWIIVGAAAAAVAVIVAQVVPGTSTGPPSAAAAVLAQAATRAGHQHPVVLAPGQYLYSETRTIQSTTWALGNNEPSWQFDTTQEETLQTWQAANGSGRELITYNGPVQFTTSASREGWVLSGKPSIAPPTNTSTGQLNSTLIASRPVGVAVPTRDGIPGAQPPDDSTLPTDANALRRVIQSGGSDIPPSVTANIPDPSTPAGTFGTAAEILETPATGISPALRSALFQVMASVPGVQLLGQATDRAGRDGTEIASPINSEGFRFEIVIDRLTGQLLQTQDVLVDPSQLSQLDQKYFGDTKGEAQSWTDYLSSGIVDSTGSVPISQQP